MRKHSDRRKIWDEKKRNFGRTTVENSKHSMWVDEEGTKRTAILWKVWASENGFVAENLTNNVQGKFIIYDAMNNRTIKVLKRSE